MMLVIRGYNVSPALLSFVACVFFFWQFFGQFFWQFFWQFFFYHITMDFYPPKSRAQANPVHHRFTAADVCPAHQHPIVDYDTVSTNDNFIPEPNPWMGEALLYTCTTPGAAASRSGSFSARTLPRVIASTRRRRGTSHDGSPLARSSRSSSWMPFLRGGRSNIPPPNLLPLGLLRITPRVVARAKRERRSHQDDETERADDGIPRSLLLLSRNGQRFRGRRQDHRLQHPGG